MNSELYWLLEHHKTKLAQSQALEAKYLQMYELHSWRSHKNKAADYARKVAVHARAVEALEVLRSGA